MKTSLEYNPENKKILEEILLETGLDKKAFDIMPYSKETAYSPDEFLDFSISYEACEIHFFEEEDFTVFCLVLDPDVMNKIVG